MSPEEQKEFVKALAESVAKNLCQKIDCGKIPAEWDGHELRAYFADQANWHMMDKKRMREYKNTLLVNAL